MISNLQIGVMQGRLLPKYKGRYQSFPADSWQKEFQIAADMGLDLIECILDYNDFSKNPLMHSSGLDEILHLSDATGVEVRTVCADYFMEAPLHSSSKSVVKTSQDVLITLIKNCGVIGISDIVIPCVDQASIKDIDSINRFIYNIHPAVEFAEDVKINLSLETDLNPYVFLKLLQQIGSQYVTVNYDTGNSAALGYNPEEEFEIYGARITDIHIKDRLLGKGSVFLGEGDVDFEAFFRSLMKIDYKGPLVMQVYRDDEGVAIFKKQLNWFTQKMNQHFFQ